MKLRFMGVVVAAALLFLAGCGGDNVQQDDRKATRTAIAAFTPTSTDTATVTETATATDTPTVTPTRTFTPTPNVTPTNTPTGTVVVSPTLGTRVFSLVDPTGLMGPSMTRAGLFTTGLNGNNVANHFVGGPIRLKAGSPDANGVAPVTLEADVEFAVDSLGGAICFKMLAEGTTGFIDCDGGTGVDVTVTQEEGPDAPPPVVTTGLGEGAPGALFLTVMQQSVPLGIGTTVDACAGATFNPAEAVVYTTGMTTATKGGAPAPIMVSGESFSCDGFTTEDGAGMIVQPSVAFNSLSPNPNVANAMRLADTAGEPPTPTPSPTATPTMEAAEPLGERVFSLVDPSGLMGPNVTRAGLFTTGLNGSNVASHFVGGPIRLVAGPVDANGVAQVTLAADVDFAVDSLGGAICFRMLKEGTTGFIDCDGGSGVDVTITQDAGGDAPPPVVMTGLGEGAPGAMLLMVMQESIPLGIGTMTDACATATLNPAEQVVYTTGMTTATKGGAPAPIMVPGESFSCDEFTVEDGPGMIVQPSVAFNTLSPNPNVANATRLADSATAP